MFIFVFLKYVNKTRTYHTNKVKKACTFSLSKFPFEKKIPDVDASIRHPSHRHVP